MLDPSWPWTRPLLWVALAALVAVLVIRAIRRDRREYQVFKNYRATADRQRMLRKWLLESFLQLGGLSVLILLLAGFAVRPLLSTLQEWRFVVFLRSALTPGLAWGLGLGVLAGLTLLTVVGVRAARKEKDITMIGDIAAMLPRNRQELVLGGVLSLNAGLVEEAMFRLAVPALVFGASHRFCSSARCTPTRARLASSRARSSGRS
jgi:membrane protease YdiL (CAAX protease family)